jgi:hypothetical protein
VGAKGAESGGKSRQIRRPIFTQIITFPDITNDLGKKGSRNQIKLSPYLPTARRFYFTELVVPLVYNSSHPTSSSTLVMQLRSQATVEIHYAALSSLPRPLPPPPRVSIASFPGGCHRFHLDRNVPNISQLLTPTTPSNRPGADDDCKTTSAIRLGLWARYLSMQVAERYWGRPYHRPHDYSILSAPMQTVGNLTA